MKIFLAWQGNQGETYWSAVTKIRNMSNEDCIASSQPAIAGQKNWWNFNWTKLERRYFCVYPGLEIKVSNSSIAPFT